MVGRRAKVYLEAVSADGRWYVDLAAGGQLRAVRISDGHTIGAHRFSSPTFGPVVLSAGDGHVLVRTTTRSHGRFTVTTSSWTPRTGAVRVLSRQRALYTVTPGVGSSAAHLYSVPRGTARGGSLMLDSRTQRRLWWVRGESVSSFSPDDRRVATIDRTYFNEDSPWGEMAGTVRVRDARTGRLQATFTGNFGWAYPTWQPIWESPTSLLLHAVGDGVYSDASESSTYPTPWVVRCSTVTATCQRVPVEAQSTELQVRKSN
ncbi:hypothetical protein GCM10009795_025670 [Nocardioides hankookensis]|uniref:Uncharacterized protein n=1 Tax=Nocardioides hankookensis TaxID=443157 RepID=A0ABW1LDN5_9ACTN